MVDYDQSFVVFTPEIWSARITRAFEARLVAGRFFDDYTDEVTAGGNTIYVPNIANAFTATAVTATSGRISYTEVADTTVAITLNQWYYAAYPMTDLQRAQYAKKYALLDEYTSKMSYALATKYDSAILALGASVTAGVGDSANDIDATTVESAIAIMESNSVPLSECAFMLHPYAYTLMCLLWETIIRKSCKFGGTLKKLFETIPSQAQLFWEGVTTKDRTPQMAMI